MTEPNPTPRQVYHGLLDRLAEFRGQVRSRLAIEGLARVLAVAAVLAILSYLLDRTFRLSVPARWAMVGFAILALLAVLLRYVVAPLRLPLDPLTLAAALDRMAGRTDGYLTTRVAAVLELPATLQQPSGTSLAMVQQTAAQCHRALSAVDLRTRLNDRRLFVTVGIAAAIVLVPASAALAAPKTAQLWAERVFGGSSRPWPQRTYLRVVGVDGLGPIVVPRGEPYTLRVAARDGSVVPEIVAVRYRDASGGRVDTPMFVFGRNDFRYEFPAVNAPVEAELTGGDDAIGPVVIRPVDRPRIADMRLVAQHPTEAKPATYTFDGASGDLSFLPRTNLRLEFTTSVPVAEARVKATGAPAANDVRRIDDQHFAVSWVAESAVQLEIGLVGAEAGLTSLPTAVSVGLKLDQPPRVTLGYTGVKTRVTTHAKIPVTADARDDYGLKSVVLSVKVDQPDAEHAGQMKSSATTRPLYGPADPATDREVPAKDTIELEDLKLPAGSVVTVTAVATDNCFVGPQSASSRSVAFRVVQPDELFREILLRQQSERAKFRKQTDEARSIRDAMNDAMTADAITELGRRHRAVQREAARVGTVLAETLTEMELNALGTEEAYELMRRNVLTPLQQMNDELMTPQKDAIDALKPGDAAGLADVRTRQDQVAAKMTELLRQMSQWDSFVDVINQLNEVIKLQENAGQKTKDLRKKQTDDVFDK